MNKKVIAHGLTEDMVSISQLYIKQGEDSNLINREGGQIVESMQHSLLMTSQRKNIDGSLGKWYCLKKKSASYFVLVEPGYPERLAYALLSVL